MRSYIELFEMVDNHVIGGYKHYTAEEKERLKEIREIQIYYLENELCPDLEEKIIKCLIRKDIEFERDKKLTELLK